MSWLDIDLEKIISDCDKFFTRQQYGHATWAKKEERKSFHNHYEQMRMNSPRGYGGEKKMESINEPKCHHMAFFY